MEIMQNQPDTHPKLVSQQFNQKTTSTPIPPMVPAHHPLALVLQYVSRRKRLARFVYTAMCNSILNKQWIHFRYMGKQFKSPPRKIVHMYL